MFKGVLKKNHENYRQPFSRGGPKRGNPTMVTSTITARRKGDPQRYVTGIKFTYNFVYVYIRIYIHVFTFIIVFRRRLRQTKICWTCWAVRRCSMTRSHRTFQKALRRSSSWIQARRTSRRQASFTTLFERGCPTRSAAIQ